MKYEFVTVEKDGEIAVLALNRPDKRNALSIRVRDEVEKCLDELEEDENVKVVIITGVGSAFCAGFDLDEFQIPDKEHQIAIHESSERFFQGFLSFKKPIIAAVNGPAMAGGFDLATFCDIRIASEKAVFGHPEIKFGLPALYSLLRFIVGDGLAKDLCLTGRRIDAKEAYRIGLVSEVVPHERLLEECKTTARQVCETPKETLMLAKKIFNEAMKLDQFSSFIHEGNIFKDLLLKR